jgi:MFS family permease
MKSTADATIATPGPAKTGYNRFLLLVAGLGGLLYGVDVGIIAGALPYLEATSGLTGNQISFIVAAVLLGSVISTLFAGLLADLMGRKKLMFASGLLFVISIPVIALAHGYGPLVFGRLLQGISAGLIGVVVPLYLAECLGAANRGKGTGMFQWLLTLGIVAAAIIGYCFSLKVEDIQKLNDAQKLYDIKNIAWRSIFWVSLPPGILFSVGSLLVAESPRWLFRKGRKEAARAALLRSRTDEEAETEMTEMEQTAASEKAKKVARAGSSESLLSRKYVLPFVLACIILACNQTTGINSIIGYNATILIQAGLSDAHAHLGYVMFTLVNFLVTMITVQLVDRKGRKFLLSLGSAGIIVSLICTALVFQKSEKHRVDVKDAVQSLVVESNQTATVEFNSGTAAKLLGGAAVSQPSTLVVIYSYGDFTTASKVVRSDDLGAKIEINRAACLPGSKVAAFFQNPSADLDKAKMAPLKIDYAIITPLPPEKTGWLTAVCLFCFMASFAIGPGVCVWLALSELMPTRIRANGMSVTLLINQAVSTTIAAVFLPTVGKYGYAAMFFFFAGCTVVYFVTAAFFLPETKGKTLEEIEKHFEGKKH